MIENCIGTIGLPVGLGLNFVINGESLIIPMVIEEPSVVGRYLNIIVYKTLIDF
jgi:hydroxymethylglutaryl-CoA reductase